MIPCLGFDKSGPSLYWIDYLGNMEKMKTGGHGTCLLVTQTLHW